MFAYIKNGKVAQIIDTESLESLEGRYAPAYVARCVPCDGTVTTGMIWDGESFSPVPSPARTADDIKKELVALDQAVVRPLHSHMAGRGTQEDLDKIEQLEELKLILRAELAALEGEA